MKENFVAEKDEYGKLKYPIYEEETIDRLQSIQDDMCQWSDNLFDSGRFRQERSVSLSIHLREEISELNEALNDFFISKILHNEEECTEENVRDEMADVMILLLDCVKHFGLSVNDLVQEVEKKMAINKKRNWQKVGHIFQHKEEQK